MRRLAWMLLLLFVFTIPWEYSLDLGPPWGNVARLAGLATLAILIPSVLQSGRVRTPGAFHVAVVLWLLWLCCTAYWSVDSRATAMRIPGLIQEMIIAWILWELVETEDDLDRLLRTYAAGAAVLACWTIGSFFLHMGGAQVRFAPEGQDPNDVARYLVLGLPIAAWLAVSSRHRIERLLSGLYLPLASTAILFTASRSGFLAGLLSLIGCGAVLWRRHPRLVLGAALLAPMAMVALWLVTPHAILLRLSSIPGQLTGGDLNQRWNIWTLGWIAFARAPIAGWGAGSFVRATHLSPISTAHNTVLAIAVEGGLVSLVLAVLVLVACLSELQHARNRLRLALATAISARIFLSLASTVEENRTTWLLLGVIVVAGRLGRQRRDRLSFLGGTGGQLVSAHADPEGV